MSTLTMSERYKLEKTLQMSGGYVLGFNDRTFAEIVDEATGVDIHAEEYTRNGKSKANKLRTFWDVESDGRVVALLEALLDYEQATWDDPSPDDLAGVERARAIVARLRTGQTSLSSLKEQPVVTDLHHLANQIRRIEASVDADPGLAIGTAKELLETCFKTILSDRAVAFEEKDEFQQLSKACFSSLELVAAKVPDETRGAEIIRRVLGNLSTIGVGITELRNLYGSGHGKHGKAIGLTPRHARLVVGAAATVATFLFETHTEKQEQAKTRTVNS